MSKRKYKPMYRICSLTQFEESNSIWFELHYHGSNRFRMWHRSALESLQVHTLINFIKYNDLYACRKVENNDTRRDD